MTPEEFARRMRDHQNRTGETPAEFARRFNNLGAEEVAQAMESLPTDALEWAVRFEAAGHREATVKVEETLSFEITETGSDPWRNDASAVSEILRERLHRNQE
jgi:hypothetical protein